MYMVELEHGFAQALGELFSVVLCYPGRYGLRDFSDTCTERAGFKTGNVREMQNFHGGDDQKKVGAYSLLMLW